MKRRLPVRVATSAIAAAMASMPVVALAQQQTADIPAAPQDDAAPDVADIVVTAQKRSERINDVPLSITAITGAQLQRQGIVTTADLPKITPGLTYTQSASGFPVYLIRGIGFFENTLAVAPAVSVYVDQVPLPYSIMTAGASLDAERVEVLKGPQGTLFGQNSTGGAINYIAAKPSTDFAAGGSVSYSRFNEIDAQGFLTGQLAEGLTARIAGRSEQRLDGWQHTYVAGDDRRLGKRNFLTGRILLDWQASDRLTLELNVNGWKNRSDTQAAQFLRYAPLVSPGQAEQAAALPTYPVAPHDPRAAEWDRGVDLKSDDGFWQTSLSVDWQPSDALTLTSITSYGKLDIDSPSDIDGTSFSNVYTQGRGRIKTFNQELRLAGDTSRFKWMIGGNYGHDQADEDRLFTNFFASNSGIVLGPRNLRYNNFNESNHQKVDTKAIFASLDYRIADRLTAQGSIRYTEQDRDFNGCLFDTGVGDLATAFSVLSSALSGSPTTIAPGACVTLGANNKPVTTVASRLDQSSVSWRASLNWKVTPETLVYANVTRGYKAGSYGTLPAASAAQYTPVPQESVLAYEVGFKTSVLDRTLQVNGAAFYYDYSKKQILGYINTGFPFGNLPGLVSIPKSRVAGGELSATWTPVRNFRFAGGVTYLSSRIRSSFVTSNPLGAAVDIQGEQFPNTPKWALLGDAQYDFDVSPTLGAYVGGGVAYRTTTNASLGNLSEFEIHSYALLDVRVGIETSNKRWSFQIFGHNITNEYYPVNILKVTDTVSQIAGFPATYGATVGFRF